MIRSFRPLAIAAATLLTLAALPAAADDGRRHVMTPTQKIDLVRDLPDEAPFERDGEHFDLGYIYPIHTMNGASVASAGGGDAGYVLYHDDKYARLSAGEVAMLSAALGEDATQGYTPPVAAAATASGTGAGSGASGQPLRSDASGGTASHRSRGLGVGGFSLFLLILVVRIGALRRMVFGGLIGLAFGRRRTARDPVATGFGDPFEARVAARMAELERGTVADPVGYEAAPVAAAPAARGFGRKGL